MKEERKIELSAVEAAKQKSLELLFDYTKLHIGLYLTLTAAYVTVATVEIDTKPIFVLVLFAVFCSIVAGFAAGVIASSITQTDAQSSQEFFSRPIGPYEIKFFCFRARNWSWVQHTAFWVGMISAILSLLIPRF